MADETTTMQGTHEAGVGADCAVELTYKAEPTLMMDCITRIKAAHVLKDRDDDSGIEYGEVDLRVCLRAILQARSSHFSYCVLTIGSPELKKEQWSVYVLDPSEGGNKFSGNGTITSVLEGDDPVPVIGKVKKKFRKEMLEIDLRLVRVHAFPPAQLTIGPHLASKETIVDISRALAPLCTTTTLPA
jgi:hypothetical protein